MEQSRILSISVIIPVYRGGENFRRCLSSVQRLAPRPLEVLVISDGGIEEDAELTREYGYQLLILPSRVGPAGARNFAALRALGDVLFFLDADVEAPPDTLDHLSRAFQDNLKIAAVFGSYDDQPADSTFLSQYRNLLHHYIHQTGSPSASTFWAGCGAIRRDVFLKLGGFDKTYQVPAVEDIELGHRLKVGGYPVRLLKTLQVKHLKRWGVVSLVKTDFFQRALPWSRLILRSHWMANDLNLKFSSRLSVVFVFVLSGSLALFAAGAQTGLLAVSAAAGLLLLNLPLHKFFLKKRGLWFSLKTVPWLWFYYFYSGLAFMLESIRFGLQASRSAQARRIVPARAAPEVENPSEVR